MNIENLGEIKSVAFDIDGTLYKNWHLYLRMFFHLLRYNQFFIKYGLVRDTLHSEEQLPDFMDEQARRMAQKLNTTTEDAKERLDKIIYNGLKKYFAKIKACTGAKECICKLKENGLKIALLSDFPPEQKGEVWGIKQYCDVILGTEAVGALKPSPIAFLEMAKKLEVSPEEILFVGNSHKFDVKGAKAAGMKSAWFVSRISSLFHKKSDEAEITFCSYPKLQRMLLGK